MTAGAERKPLVVIGDALLDRDVVGDVERLSPDAPVPVLEEATVLSRPGGAGLAALLAAADGREVTLVTALSDDAPGRELADALAGAGVEVLDLGLDGPTPEKVRLIARDGPGEPAGDDGRSLLRIDRGGAPDDAVGPLTAAARAAIGWADAVLVADYGRGVAAEPGVRAALAALPEVASRPGRRTGRPAPIVWDPHLRGAEPVPGVALATPNVLEAWSARREPRRGAATAAGAHDDGLGALAGCAAALASRWRARHVCVTRGGHGALLVGDGPPLVVPADPVAGADPCGAGDRFASASAGMLAEGAPVTEAVVEAVACASVFVANGGGREVFRGRRPARAPARGQPSADEVVAAVRAAGGTVVATGGCFDLLHAGHVRMLEAARSLGDCLVVCLNSDASVRRIKGSDRPLVPEDDRVAVLRGLGCVDAVAVFEEDTPDALIERLGPDVWAKGGDYQGRELPERDVVERAGGRAVILPYLAGRSTTRLIEEATIRAAG